MTPGYHIRPEQGNDQPAVHRVNSAAFGQTDEAELVDRLRAAPSCISLVAEAAGLVVGHIFFSPVSLEHGDPSPPAMALGPMAVELKHQGCGIGKALVKNGLMVCKMAGHPLVFVLGHPWFYPKFGFIPAATLGFECQWEVADPYFMVLELEKDSAASFHGLVRYRPEFSNL